MNIMLRIITIIYLSSLLSWALSTALSISGKPLIPEASIVESKVLNLTVRGDTYRSLAQVATSVENKNTLVAEAQKAYEEALIISASELAPTDPIRLRLALSLSVFNYENLGRPDTALLIAQKAFDDANAELDTLDDEAYKATAPILQLLRDNITTWTAAMQPDEEVEIVAEAS